MPYDAATATGLEAARLSATPSFAPGREPLRPVLIHGTITILYVILCLRAFLPGGLLTWSVGIVYVAYDAALMGFVWWNMRSLGYGRPVEAVMTLPAVTVVIAAFNEARVLERTIASLAAQTVPAACIVLTDDGSTDGTPALMSRAYGLQTPATGEFTGRSPVLPALRWLRLPHGGKARALNEAIARIDTPLVLTVDADTRLRPDALEAMTGEREMSGKALVEYFAPLKAWLDEQNRGKPVGW